jgi:Right handed beta helix region
MQLLSFRNSPWGRNWCLRSDRRQLRSRVRLTIEALESRQLLTSFYVAGGAGSGGDGSLNDPWQSIAVVNDHIAAGQILPGDYLEFQRGDTFPGNLVFNNFGGAPGAPITIVDYGDPNAPLPTIRAGSGTGISVRGAGYFDVSNLEIAGNYDPVHNPTASDGNGIEFLDTDSSNLAGISLHDLTVQGFGELQTANVPFDTGCAVLFYDGVNHPSQGYAYDVITISRCEISNCQRAGIELWDDRSDALEPYAQLMYADIQIDHVKVHNIIPPQPALPIGVAGGEGILLMGVEDAVVERCQVYDNGSLVDNNGNRLFLDTGVGIWCTHSDHVLFQYNEVHDNHSQAEWDEGGFAFGRWTTNSIMQYNYSHDNDGYGYMLESNGVSRLMSENNSIRFNISENDSRQSRYGAMLFESWAASDVYVYNNTFYLSDNGLGDPANDNYYVAPAIRFDGDDSSPLAAPTIYVYNNIFLTSSASAGTSVPVILVERDFPVSSLTFQGNDYFSNGPAPLEIYWAGTTFTSLSGWGQDPKAVSADPRLGFEHVTGSNHFPSAYTVRDIDDMASELSALFELTSTIPAVIRTGGVDLAAIDPKWWLLDGFDWDEACGQAADLWGTPMPDASGEFSMGASEYHGF